MPSLELTVLDEFPRNYVFEFSQTRKSFGVLVFLGAIRRKQLIDESVARIVAIENHNKFHLEYLLFPISKKNTHSLAFKFACQIPCIDRHCSTQFELLPLRQWRTSTK